MNLVLYNEVVTVKVPVIYENVDILFGMASSFSWSMCSVFTHTPRSRGVFTILSLIFSFVSYLLQLWLVPKDVKWSVVCSTNPRLDIWCTFFNRNDAYAWFCLNNTGYLMFQCVSYFEYAQCSSLLVMCVLLYTDLCVSLRARIVSPGLLS